MQSFEDKESMQFCEGANTNLHGLHCYNVGGGGKNPKGWRFWKLQISTFIRFGFLRSNQSRIPVVDPYIYPWWFRDPKQPTWAAKTLCLCTPKPWNPWIVWRPQTFGLSPLEMMEMGGSHGRSWDKPPTSKSLPPDSFATFSTSKTGRDDFWGWRNFPGKTSDKRWFSTCVCFSRICVTENNRQQKWMANNPAASGWKITSLQHRRQQLDTERCVRSVPCWRQKQSSRPQNTLRDQ